MLHHMATILVCYGGHFESKMAAKIQKSSDLGKIWFPSRLWCCELISIVWEPCYDPSDHIIFFSFYYLLLIVNVDFFCLFEGFAYYLLLIINVDFAFFFEGFVYYLLLIINIEFVFFLGILFIIFYWYLM